MRFLADAGVSPKTIEFLKQFGHEATHVRSLGLQRAPDAELVQRARTDHSIIITFDLDFGDILALGVLDKPSVIIFRLADERVDSVHQRLAVVLTERHVDLEAGALILVEDTRYRVRKLPTWAQQLTSTECHAKMVAADARLHATGCTGRAA